MHFGEIVEKERKKRKWTQEDLVRHFNETPGSKMSKTSLSHYERGTVQPKVDLACKLIKFFDLNPMEICELYTDDIMPHIIKGVNTDKSTS